MVITETEDTQRLAFSVPDACAALSIGRNTFYAEVAAGRIKVKKSGRRTLVPAAQIKAWLDNLPEKAA